MFGRGMGMGGCKRCSMCAIHFPPRSEFDTCKACGDPTCYFKNVEPDEDWEDRVKYATSHPEAKRVGKDPHEHRFDQYLRLGFTEDGAQLLASATYGSPPFPLWHEKVRVALANGCSHDLALAIFA